MCEVTREVVRPGMKFSSLVKPSNSSSLANQRSSSSSCIPARWSEVLFRGRNMIESASPSRDMARAFSRSFMTLAPASTDVSRMRSEEHTSELQSRGHLVCRLLLEKKNETNQCDACNKM